MVNLISPSNDPYDEMVRMFGGDNTAVRAANALTRESIPSMAALDGLLVALGERGLRERLVGVRNLGEKALGRIAQALTEYRKGDGHQAGATGLEAVLPEGFAHRAYCTARHLTVSKEEPFPDVFGFGEPMGLTRKDLIALSKLFSHEILIEDI